MHGRIGFITFPSVSEDTLFCPEVCWDSMLCNINYDEVANSPRYPISSYGQLIHTPRPTNYYCHSIGGKDLSVGDRVVHEELKLILLGSMYVM